MSTFCGCRRLFKTHRILLLLFSLFLLVAVIRFFVGGTKCSVLTHTVPFSVVHDVTEEDLTVLYNDTFSLPRRTCVSKFVTALPHASSLLPDLKSHGFLEHPIFMVETSGRGELSFKEACAVESAAKYHPNSTIVFFMVSEVLTLDSLSLPILRIKNVRVAHLNLTDFFCGTELESWYYSKKRRNSPYKNSHMSDAFRFLVLYKFGGSYLDTDVVVLKSLGSMISTLGFEDKPADEDPFVAVGILSNFDLTTGDKPHAFISDCVHEFCNSYSPSNWGYNGPGVVTRVLKKWCNVEVLRNVSRCKDVTIVPPSAFYAIGYLEYRKFFDAVPKTTEEVLEKLENSYVAHVWNRFSSSQTTSEGSAYDILTSLHCPSVYVAGAAVSSGVQ